jgi:hypothetical protein
MAADGPVEAAVRERVAVVTAWGPVLKLIGPHQHHSRPPIAGLQAQRRPADAIRKLARSILKGVANFAARVGGYLWRGCRRHHWAAAAQPNRQPWNQRHHPLDDTDCARLSSGES